ncbi:HAMP domain-containing histidine kinase [Clostridium sp. MSJ-8]|uniref:sensor histidine kinase n=1 Tax=Clostridium sp. MSJ-8 TaxID=2841510 RepID=UPI001C0EF77E|nr:HAMP domain-containing sensor histidine kinase [Clostridium sp. MSJ-8]MBU5486727.1 HAMP domain-containing histidine kinase [Clostridium sp. MSJ-8]
MNKNSLLYKIITNFTAILAIILVASSIILTFAFRSIYSSYFYDKLEKQGEIITDLVNTSLVEGESSYKSLQLILDNVKDVMDTDVLVCDNIEFVYAGSKEIKKEMSKTKISIDEQYASKLQNNEIVKDGEVKTGDSSKEAYLKPIFKSDKYWGAIIYMPSDSVMNGYLFKVYKIIWISTLVTLVLAVAGANYLTKKQLVNPLKEIYLVANKLARGEVTNRIQVKSNDEIGELGRSFNLMAESLEAVDTNRRDFISNVSHELRSPITSMKGFIAGMLDGVIPKDKENYYLKLVYDEINRLSRLVNDLLDISSMEVGKFKLTIMEVDINALVKRCLLNIESKVKDKGIHINASLENEHLYVYADSDRIMQVLTNLLDNAIKYGGEEGIISVSTRIKGPKVHVAVYNKGSKMTEEEMAHIWDRFYKSDKSRTNKESTGLGLPIVRLIMTQHKEDVWVRNEREGVVFTFTLAKV